MTHNTPCTPTPREIILALLRAAETWVSGQAVSQRLGISRAAVGKHITALRNEGHAIEASTRKGYKLLATQDTLCGEALAASLATRVFGKTGLTVLRTTASTNLDAAHLAEEGVGEGHVVVAEMQTKGRGRKGHEWFSAPRSLQFSVLLYPQASSWDAEAFTRMAALAVAKALCEDAGVEAVFAMPNDVFIQGKKVAGVLVETGYRGGEPEWAVVGVGCNVNALPEEFPESVRGRSTSVLAASGKPASRDMLLKSILEKLETAYETLRGNTP